MTHAELSEAALADFVAQFYDDPLGFVVACFPWGEPGGPLERYTGPDTWQVEALERIGAAVQHRAFDGLNAVEPIRIAVSSGHGIGKALSDRTLIPTPAGEQRMSDLRVGMTVFAEDGTPTEVLGVYPQGHRPLYRVMFSDGSSVEADAGHLWKVRGRTERRHKRDDWRVLSTQQLMDIGVVRANGRTTTCQWEVPTQGAAQFPPRSVTVTIPGYVLGVWLGDGGRRSSVITSMDDEVIDRLRTLGERVTTDPKRPLLHRVSMLLPRLKALGISECYSYQKSVPVSYMEAGAATRAEVLRGLLDTDGECSSAGSVLFNSCSRALCEDVVWLVRSLGGTARIQPTVKRPTYRGADGERKDGRPCWRVTIRMPAGFRCFYIARKQARVPATVEARYLARWITAIVPIGEGPATCIRVAHPSQCFLANDFIVTHNSTLQAWLVLWIMSTRPNCRGTVTANTATQLETKTWAALQVWHKRLICAHWFEANAARLFRKGSKEGWFVAPQSCREENSEAFAGQHAADSTSFYIIDEGSAVPDVIYNVAEGGLTDGEPMIFVFGNCTRSSGRFHAICFGHMRTRWNPIVVDSRTSQFTNKAQIAEWEADYGEDSDFFRVRVKGLPPRASDLQFIGSDMVLAAQSRPLSPSMPDEPLVCGLDLSRGGADDTVFRFRRGTDARSIPEVRVAGDRARDSMQVATLAADILARNYTVAGQQPQKVTMMFVDATGGSIGGPIADRLRQLGHKNVIDVQFGGESPDPKLGNMRAFMWDRLRTWLGRGCIDGSPALEQDLVGPGYKHDKSDRVLLESKEAMKERGLDSPDHGDALALTFAQRVNIPAPVSAPYKPVSRWG